MPTNETRPTESLYAKYLRRANAPHVFKPGGRTLGPILLKLNAILFRDK